MAQRRLRSPLVNPTPAADPPNPARPTTDADARALTMIPKEPQRRPQLGFLYLPPFRVQGISIAGEETSVQVPELDLCFDIGKCPRAALACPYVALSHGHMDHAAGLAYYFSQRHFQGMGTGTVLCPAALEQPIHNLMRAWIDLEAQRTPYNVVAMTPGQELQIKPHMHLRAFQTMHTVPSLGYVVIERRSKLKPELVGLPQEQLVELKKKGVEITHELEIPLVCYMGDTMWGVHFEREDVLNAKILITECTFLEQAHRSRAQVGQHLHLSDIVRLLRRSKAEAVVLIHMSRRTNMGVARKIFEQTIPEEDRERVLVLMDGRTNRARLEKQAREAEERAAGEAQSGSETETKAEA
jgi:ribonuclease Z